MDVAIYLRLGTIVIPCNFMPLRNQMVYSLFDFKKSGRRCPIFAYSQYLNFKKECFIFFIIIIFDYL